MAAQVSHRPTWLVDPDGNFNPNIEQHLNLALENSPVAAVSIMGVQSTGKSTLLNKCFATYFQEMDESRGISQTTKGIWIAKCPLSPNGIGGPKTTILVIDTEGSDGSERGQEGNDAFEKKSALFALATSNTVIINMKCDNVGLHQGASRPLLKTVFQVMLCKFSTRRQVNLVFVLRDKNRSPLEKLKKQLIGGLHEIWQGMSRPKAHLSNVALEDYFNIEVMAMSHYVLQREEFDTEVDNLRDRIFSLVQHGQPDRASAFVALAKTNWKDIMEDNILNLNLNKITVDRVLCHDVMEKKRRHFVQEKSWLQIESAVKSGTRVQGFGKLVSSIIGNYLSQYDEETLYTDEGPRNDYKTQLTEKLSEVVEKSYISLVDNMRNATLEKFVKQIAEGIERGGKIVAVDSKKFITEFTDFLEDVHVQLPNWNYTSKQQLEIMQSQLASYEEGARHILETLRTLKRNKKLMLTGAATFTAEALAYVAALASTILLPGPGTAAGVGAVAAAATCPLPVASVSTFIAAFLKYKETKRKMREARENDKALDHIMRKYEGRDSG